MPPPFVGPAESFLPDSGAGLGTAGTPAEPVKLIFDDSPGSALEPPQLAPPKRPARPLVLALEAFLNNRPEEAIRQLHTLAARDQEVVMRLLPLLAAIDQGGLLIDRPKAELVQQQLASLREIEAELRAAAPLHLERLVFCHEIKSFGRFTPVKSAQFQPGESKWLYAEVRNLVDRRLPDGLHAVRLKGMIELRDSEGKPVGPVEWMHSDANSSASARQDYFVRMDFRVPPRLPPGPYTVRVRIDDLDTGRAAEASLPFQVVPRR